MPGQHADTGPSSRAWGAWQDEKCPRNTPHRADLKVRTMWPMYLAGRRRSCDGAQARLAQRVSTGGSKRLQRLCRLGFDDTSTNLSVPDDVEGEEQQVGPD